jgi:lipopolysaccharide export system permease protein
MMPIYLFTVFFSSGLFFFNEYIAYPAYYQSMNQFFILKWNEEIKRVEVQKNFHCRSDNRYYHIGFHDKGNITNLHLTITDDHNTVQEIIIAKTAFIRPGAWELHEGSISYFTTEGKFDQVEYFANNIVNIPDDSEIFNFYKQNFEEMNIFQIKSQIEIRKKRGEDIREYLVELYWHYSFPFVCFFITLIGGILGSRVKKGAMSASIAISTVVTMVYYIIMFFGKSIAVKGILPPMIGAWLANIVFTISSIFILIRYRQ